MFFSDESQAEFSGKLIPAQREDGVRAGKSTASWHKVSALFRGVLLTSHDAHLPVPKGTDCSSWMCICFHLQLDIKITLNHKDQMLFSLCPMTAYLNYWAGLGWAGLGCPRSKTAPAFSMTDGVFIWLGFGCRGILLILGCLKYTCMASKHRIFFKKKAFRNCSVVTFGGCSWQIEEEGNRENLKDLPGP